MKVSEEFRDMGSSIVKREVQRGAGGSFAEGGSYRDTIFKFL